MLMARMELPWYGSDSEAKEFIESAYEMLFRYDRNFSGLIAGANEERLLYSPFGPDWLLLRQFAAEDSHPLEEALEICLDNRQLALQRLLQERYDEAIRLHPSAFFYCAAGEMYYYKGEIAAALEVSQSAYQMAAQEGYPRIMLHCKLIMGNCYSNQNDLAAMERHYSIARRLAEALDDREALVSIAYNTAATQLQSGQYEKALAYFRQLETPNRMDLHKLAVCCEKLGLEQEALDALERAKNTEGSPWMPVGLEDQMLSLVHMRLTDPEYLKNSRYGEALLECFRRCREALSSGYSLFHLPWVLEWYEASRQYKQALLLMKHFPEFQKNFGLKK